MTSTPETPAMRRAIAQYQRRQDVLRRREAGETLASIAKDLGIGISAVSQLAAAARKENLP